MKGEKLTKVAVEEVERALSSWNIPEMPSLTSGQMKLEVTMVDWLWHLIRQNVKRGRFFLLTDVLAHKQADCLGFAQLLNCLGRRYGLDIGIVEVIIDNAGRYTPHYVNILKLSPNKWQCLDLWYGSKNIRHRRIGAQVKAEDRWEIRDLDWEDLQRAEDIQGLPQSYVEGIIYYILGNRHLERGIRLNRQEDLDTAIACYTEAIHLYPGYARAYFNRAIAYENKGNYAKACEDYTQALRDEASQLRVLAREYEEVVRLMDLDKANVGGREQEIYLLRKGFITGQEVASATVARQFGISEREVNGIISQIEAKCGL